jgi:hypothetical protein
MSVTSQSVKNMSVDINTYVGPYLKVYNPKKDSYEKYNSCSDKKCPKYKEEINANFCPHCGAKIKTISIPSKEKISMWEVLENLGETLSEAMTEYKPDKMDDYTFVIPNTYFLKRKTNFNGDREAYIVTCYGEMVTQEALLFDKQFRKEITVIREKFGDINVNLEWGVLGWMG